MQKKYVDLSKLSPDEREAIHKWVADFQKGKDEMIEMARVSAAIFDEFKKCDYWGVADAQPPNGSQPPSDMQWDIGAPELNFVDSIGDNDDG